jgi:hypothetical protein
MEPSMFARVYPGVDFTIGDKTYTVQAFLYSDTSFRVLTESKSFYFKLQDGVFVTERPHSEVVRISNDPHPLLIEIYTRLPSNVLTNFFTFMSDGCYGMKSMNREEFDTTLQQQYQAYAYYFSGDPSSFLKQKIESFFVVRIPHDRCCTDNEIGGHACDINAHIYFLLQTIHDGAENYQVTENGCLGIAQSRWNGVTYVHVTPGGSMIVVENHSGLVQGMGQGINIHPLVQILFWHSLLQKRPDFLELFNSTYLDPLNKSLIQKRFISAPCSDVQSMIQQFNTSICINCFEPPSKICHLIKSFGETAKIYAFCSHNDYEYGLLLLGVLKNGWHSNRTYLDYMGNRLKIVYHPSELQFGNEHFMAMFRGGFLKFISDNEEFLKLIPNPFPLPDISDSETSSSDDD